MTQTKVTSASQHPKLPLFYPILKVAFDRVGHSTIIITILLEIDVTTIYDYDHDRSFAVLQLIEGVHSTLEETNHLYYDPTIISHNIKV